VENRINITWIHWAKKKQKENVTEVFING